MAEPHFVYLHLPDPQGVSAPLRPPLGQLAQTRGGEVIWLCPLVPGTLSLPGPLGDWHLKTHKHTHTVNTSV